MEVPDLDPVLHQAQRLRIMTVLFRNRELAVATIRNLLTLTDGNLASHLQRLQTAGYVRTGRVLVGLSFEMHAKITDEGSRRFQAYLADLRRLLEATGKDPFKDEPRSREGVARTDASPRPATQP